MKNKNKDYKTTTNSSVYNKIHKEVHANCSYCRWNCGCNSRDKFYSFEGRIPNWKLSTKNKKQWMKKTLKRDKFHNGYSW